MTQLLSYSIENFRSFYNEQVVSLGDNDARKVTALFGPNAGGKSNTARALAVFQGIVFNSANANFVLPYEPFELRDGSTSKETIFEIRYKHDFRFFIYKVAYNATQITEETLKEKSEQVEKYKTIFSRNTTGELNASAIKFGFGKTIQKKTRRETLIITKAREDNNEFANIIFELMDSLLIVQGDGQGLENYAVDLIKSDPRIKERTIKLLRNCDFSIRDVQIVDVPVSEESLASLPLSDEIKQIIMNSGATAISTAHVIRDNNRKIVGTKEFTLMNQESMGTRKFFEIAAPILHVLDIGGTLYIDEFAAYFHPSLANAIIELFKSEENNNGATLILNSHNTSIMGQTCLGREDIYLVEKNMSEESIITPLKQKAVRENEALEKRYRNGLYGGIPIVRERT